MIDTLPYWVCEARRERRLQIAQANGARRAGARPGMSAVAHGSSHATIGPASAS